MTQEYCNLYSPKYVAINNISTFFPAIGFNVETVQYKNLKFQVWDLGGQTSIRLVHACFKCRFKNN